MLPGILGLHWSLQILPSLNDDLEPERPRKAGNAPSASHTTQSSCRSLLKSAQLTTLEHHDRDRVITICTLNREGLTDSHRPWATRRAERLAYRTISRVAFALTQSFLRLVQRRTRERSSADSGPRFCFESQLGDRACRHSGDLAREPVGEIGQRGIMACEHNALEPVIEVAQHAQHCAGLAGIEPLVRDDVLASIAESLGHDPGRCDRPLRRARQDQIRIHLALGNASAHLPGIAFSTLGERSIAVGQRRPAARLRMAHEEQCLHLKRLARRGDWIPPPEPQASSPPKTPDRTGRKPG